MTAKFTDDDRDKPVYTSGGDRIGTVSAIHDDTDTATVRREEDSDEGLTDKVKDMLGWDDDSDEHDLRSDHVDRRDDDGIHLRDHR